MERAASRGGGSAVRAASDICIGAACSGQLQVLELKLAARHLDLSSSAPACAAAYGGDDSLMALEWLLKHGVRFDASVSESAASSSDIATLTWLRDVAHCPMDSRACVAAAMGRQFSIAREHHPTERLQALQWLLEAGCHLTPAVWEAAEDDVRKWLCALPARPWDNKLVLEALRKGDEALAEWAIANEPDAAQAVKTRGCETAIACRWGAKEMVTWARAHGAEWSAACSVALATGEPRFDLVRHCVSDGCGVIEAMFNHAVSNGPVDLAWEALKTHLEFLQRHGCPWSAATMAAAAARDKWRYVDDIRVETWLWNEGCPCDASACAASARLSHPLIRELHAMGFPLDWTVCVAAAQAGHLDALQWAHSRGCPLGGCADLVIQAAPVREWLLAQGVPCRGEDDAT